MMQISVELRCSHHKVAYWMNEYGIKRRTRSEAVYLVHNPHGDPFTVKQPVSHLDHQLFGLGLGLYWGEGTKSDKNAVRLGNTDPSMINAFILFLTRFYGVERSSLRFGLQIFSDISPREALRYWSDKLDVSVSQFYKPTVTRSGSIGTYRVKSRHGVVTVRFGNTKLRDIIVEQVAEIAQLAERVNGNDKVTGSIPVLGSN